MDLRFSRCQTLFGEDDFSKIQSAKILLLGVGGVGSFALDCLYRSGVSDITIVDYDRYDVTNQNRQIGSDRVGELKTEVLAKLYPTIKTINAKIDEEWVRAFDFDSFDIVIDCIDSTKAKIAIASKVYKKLIMSLGSAKRFDTTSIKVDSIWRTSGDAFARKIRYELKKARFDRNFITVFSTEDAKCKDKGSCVAVTGAFGLTICSEAIKKILKS
ncbi:MAG: tRNA threonylcarbamoyladenosine dehydratase [Sulfurovum sp.]|nr:MAG: tRNA threonylcarbamoyladenosine dehydratase [Sulfurovum sp.]